MGKLGHSYLFEKCNVGRFAHPPFENVVATGNGY